MYCESVPVYVVPNSIDARWFRETLRGCDRIPELKDKLTIGWCGGTREEIDMAPLAEAWPIIAQRYPEVEFVIQGHISDRLYNATPAERRHTLPWLPLPEYPRAMLNIDIGCCSVGAMGFNHSKSAIKFYEFTLAGAATVVSPTVYGREVTDGHDALVAETAEEWVVALSRLIESAELRKALKRNARKTVMEHHSLENNWWKWPAAWSEAIDVFRNKPQLVTSLSA
jgi:glycosyltransferase involved in cell wall biosynthesis